MITLFLRVLFVVWLIPMTLRAWDAPGHRIVNQLALDSLPEDYPAFARDAAAAARIAFLAGEPDRWSHAIDLPLKHHDWMDHYLDVEQVADAGLDPAQLPSLRYDFSLLFAAGRAVHPEKFAYIDMSSNPDHTKQWCGFLPWTVTEAYGKLKAAFSSLKVYRELGTPEEVANAEANVVYLMGIMGHYVGDLSEPLHTTIHHDGWAGANPKGYYVGKGFHTWIDSGLITKAAISDADIRGRVVPAQPLSLAQREDGRDPVFVAVMACLMEQNRQVEPLYQLENEGRLGRGENAVSPEARSLIEGQLLRGGQFLGAIWLTAWRAAQPESYLRSVLIKRQSANAPAPMAK
jgi:hypothetical protein